MTTRNTRRNITVRTLSPAPTPEHEAGFYEDRGRGTITQFPIRAWASGSGLPCDVEFLVAISPTAHESGRIQFVIVELILRPKKVRGARPLDTSVLRAPFDLPALTAAAVANAATHTNAPEAPVAVESVKKLTRGPSQRGGTRRIPDDHAPKLRKLAETHGRGASAIVAETYGVARTTAWRAIQRALAADETKEN